MKRIQPRLRVLSARVKRFRWPSKPVLPAEPVGAPIKEPVTVRLPKVRSLVGRKYFELLAPAAEELAASKRLPVRHRVKPKPFQAKVKPRRKLHPKLIAKPVEMPRVEVKPSEEISELEATAEALRRRKKKKD